MIGIADEGRLGRMRRGPSLRSESTLQQGVGSLIASVDCVLPASRTEPPLSPRQLEFLRLLAEGYTYSEIAVRCGVGTSRVHNALNEAYTRLGVSAAAGQKSAIDAFRVLGWLRVTEALIAERDPVAVDMAAAL